MAADFKTLVGLFPEFDGTSEAQAAYWLALGTKLYGSGRFGDQTELMILLYTAHNLAVGGVTAKKGATATLAPVNAKSIDKLSVSYDTGATTIAGAGPWNATSYGQRLYALVQGAAQGPFYVARGPTVPRGYPR